MIYRLNIAAKLVSVLFFLVVVTDSTTASNNDSGLDSLYANLNELSTHEERAKAYCNIASYCLNIQGKEFDFDSISKLAIAEAESSFNPKFILQINMKYLDKCSSSSSKEQINKIISRSKELILKEDISKQFDNWIILSKANLSINNIQEAHSYALKAFTHSATSRSSIKIIKSQLALGNCAEKKHSTIEAFQHYMNSLYESESIENKEVQVEYKNICYEMLFKFHQSIRNFNDAGKYKQKLVTYYANKSPMDSTKYYWQKMDLLGLSLKSENYGLITEKFEDILSYALRANNINLKNYLLRRYRYLFIETSNYKGFYDLYIKRFPGELEMLKKADISIYYRIVGYIHQYKNQLDSVNYFFDLAEKNFSKESHSMFLSNFYLRYGELLFKNGQTKKAYDMYKKSLMYAKQENHIPFMLASAQMLDSISCINLDYQEAYKYQEIINNCLIEQENRTDEYILLRIELDSSAKQLELNQRRAIEEQKKKHDLQYFIMTVGLVVIFLSIILLSQIAIPEWVIRTMGFMGVLMLFEFIILILDEQIHHWTHGAPLYIFLIKIVLLSILFPLHHLIEKKIIKFLIAQKRLRLPSLENLKQMAYELWPYLKKK